MCGEVRFAKISGSIPDGSFDSLRSRSLLLGRPKSVSSVGVASSTLTP
jgi:hypothetical protein